MTSIAIDKSILLSAQRALHDAARQFESKPVEPGQARSLSYSDVVDQLKSRHDGGASGDRLAASIQGSPELTAPAARAALFTPTREARGSWPEWVAHLPRDPDASFKSEPVAIPRNAAVASSDTFDPSKLSGAASIRYWVAIIQDAVDTATDSQLVSTLERFSAANKAQQSLSIKEESEAIKKEEAAAKAAEIMGCIGKIIGAIIVAVSVVSSIVTGGSSLVFAGIGLALMAADALSEAITGDSLTGKLLSPLIENVFAPMAKAMGDLIANTLKSLGVDSDIADTIGAVAGAIAAAVAVIAVAVVAKSANIAKFAGKLAAPMMKSVARMMPKIISGIASKLSGVLAKVSTKASGILKDITRNISRLSEKLGMGTAELASAQASRLALIAGGLNGTAQAGHRAYQGVNANQLAQLYASLTELLGEHDGLSRMMDQAVEFWKQQSSQKGELEQIATDAMQSSQNAQLFVLKNARNAAV